MFLSLTNIFRIVSFLNYNKDQQPKKLDRVGPVDDKPPPTSFTTLPKKEEEKK